MKKRFGISSLFSMIIMIFVVLISLTPIIWVFLSSFKTYRELFSSALSWPASFSLKSYKDAITLSPIIQYFGNSLMICILNTTICIAVTGAFAYVASRFKFHGKGFLILLISLALMLPYQSTAQPIFVMFEKLNLLDTRTGLILLYAGFGIPISFFIMYSYFSNIPKEMEESAYIDGANFFNTYIRIILPIAKPGMATAAVIQFLSMWNEFFYALMLTTGNKARTVPLALNYYITAFRSNYSALFAAIIITILPPIIVFVLGQEMVIKSLTAGAVKE